MSFIWKLLRVAFFYAVFFIIATIIVAIAFQGWPVGGQMLFSYGVPVILVWWMEKRRSRKKVPNAPVEGGSDSPVPQPPQDNGRMVYVGQHGTTAVLGERIGAGGEGQVFCLKNDSRVAKIFHENKLTDERRAKLEYMTSNDIRFDGICWPEQIVFSNEGTTVGYVMQRAQGVPLQKSVFVKQLLTKKFPNWNRENLVKVCIAFLERMQFLHSNGVLVGDINPLNVLVSGDGSDLCIVDADSFQIGRFPCPVGTINFTPPELQGKNFRTILRTEHQEQFSIATMLFMILLLGKPPYQQRDGESPEKNIREANFPYSPYSRNTENLSAGPWRFIWSHLPNRLQKAFHRVFADGDRIEIFEWLTILREYKNQLERGESTRELFPTRFFIAEGMGEMVACGMPGCGKKFEMDRDVLKNLLDNAQFPICPNCFDNVDIDSGTTGGDNQTTGGDNPITGGDNQPTGGAQEKTPSFGEMVLGCGFIIGLPLVMFFIFGWWGVFGVATLFALISIGMSVAH
ncbi:MAG: hypothetical protein OXC26_03095 [Albidovulum sp.]|nr:hypothetical protein [Albidovulum sp.]